LKHSSWYHEYKLYNRTNTLNSYFLNCLKAWENWKGSTLSNSRKEQSPFRRVAIPLMPAVKTELERMEEPTEWCAGIMVVPKAQGKVIINYSVRRERYPMPAVEQTLAQVPVCSQSWMRIPAFSRSHCQGSHPCLQHLLRPLADTDSIDCPLASVQLLNIFNAG
jgi:hypothetical protein